MATAALRVAPGPSAHDLAVVEHDHAVGDFVRLRKVMRGEKHRAALVPEVSHHPPEALAGLHVHRGGRLVEEDDLGVAGDRDRRSGHAGPGRLKGDRFLGGGAHRCLPRSMIWSRCRPGVKLLHQTEDLVHADAGGQADA